VQQLNVGESVSAIRGGPPNDVRSWRTARVSKALAWNSLSKMQHQPVDVQLMLFAGETKVTATTQLTRARQTKTACKFMVDGKK